jgi:hypothetical protein
MPTFTRPILHREDDLPGVPEVDLSPLASAQARRAARQTDTRDRVIPSPRVVANR